MQSVLTIDDEEILNDSLIDNYEVNLWPYLCLIVNLVESLLELADLMIDDLASLGLANSISIYKYISGLHLIILRLEYFESVFYTILDS